MASCHAVATLDSASGLRKPGRSYSRSSQTARSCPGSILTCWANTISRTKSSRIRSGSSPQNYRPESRLILGAAKSQVSLCICGFAPNLVAFYVPLLEHPQNCRKPSRAQKRNCLKSAAQDGVPAKRLWTLYCFDAHEDPLKEKLPPEFGKQGGM